MISYIVATGGGGGGGGIHLYTFLLVEHSKLDRNLAPSQLGLAVRDMVTWLGVYKEVVRNWIVNLGVVHVLQTFRWCLGYFLVGRLEIG